MALFLAVAIGGSTSALDAAVTNAFPGRFYKIEPGKFAIDADVSTTRELSEQLGLSTTDTFIAVPITAYFGRAQPDLWEWLAAKATKRVG